MSDEYQPQKTIPLKFKDGTCGGVAIRNGNNAAWMCVCGYHLPLIWSGHIAYDSKKDKKPFTVCGKCGKKFQGDKTIPTKIMEVK